MKELTLRDLNHKTPIKGEALKGALMLANVMNALTPNTSPRLHGDIALAKCNLLGSVRGFRRRLVLRQPRANPNYSDEIPTRDITYAGDQAVQVELTRSISGNEILYVFGGGKLLLCIVHRTQHIMLNDMRLDKPDLVRDYLQQTFEHAKHRDAQLRVWIEETFVRKAKYRITRRKK